jgi:hypothetical protein
VCSVVVYVAAALCVWMSVCMLLFDFRERPCVVVSVWCCAAALLCVCVALRFI